MLTEIFTNTAPTVDVDGSIESNVITLDDVLANPDKTFHPFQVTKGVELKIIETLFPEKVSRSRDSETGIVKDFDCFIPDDVLAALEIAKALTMDGQRDAVDDDGNKIPNPNKKNSYDSDWLKEPCRLPMFNYFAIYRPVTTDPDPFLLAREGSWSGRWHLIGRWGEALDSWQEMKKRAFAKLSNRFRLSIAKAKAEIVGQEEMLKALSEGAADEEVFDTILEASELSVKGGIEI
jgi:hypothetical protein